MTLCFIDLNYKIIISLNCYCDSMRACNQTIPILKLFYKLVRFVFISAYWRYYKSIKVRLICFDTVIMLYDIFHIYRFIPTISSYKNVLFYSRIWKFHFNSQNVPQFSFPCCARRKYKSKMANKKDHSNKLCFGHAFQPAYFFSRIFGQIPFTITFNSNGDIQEPHIKKRDIIWLIISIFMYSFVSFLIYRTMKYSQDPNMSSYILVFGDFISVIIVIMCGGVLGMGIDIYNRYKIVDILQRIHQFDKQVNLCENIWLNLCCESIVSYFLIIRLFNMELISITKKKFNALGNIASY